MKRQTTASGLFFSGKSWEIRAALRVYRSSSITLERYLAMAGGAINNRPTLQVIGLAHETEPKR